MTPVITYVTFDQDIRCTEKKYMECGYIGVFLGIYDSILVVYSQRPCGHEFEKGCYQIGCSVFPGWCRVWTFKCTPVVATRRCDIGASNGR